MSGRTPVILADGRRVTGFRKTLRRQSPKRPLLDRLHEINERQARRAPSGWEVRVGFLLPRTLCGFVASGPHGSGVTVTKDFVQVSHSSADECFQRACDFLGIIARDRAAFTVTASIISLSRPGEHYGRHLTVSRGTLYVSSGVVPPKVYEPREGL